MLQGALKKEHVIRFVFVAAIAVLFMFTAGVMTVHADDPSGEQGGVHWVIEDGVLVIGNGNDVTVTMDTGTIMTEDMWGWYPYRDQITAVYFKGTVKAKGVLSAMFTKCTNLEYINFEHLDTSDITSMYAMFGGCKSLTGLDLSWMDVSSCQDYQGMFAGCSSLELIRLPFDMNGNMAAMFSNCKKLKSIDLSTAKGAGESMYNMFFYCEALENVYFSDDFDTSSVTNMESTFSHCENLKNVNVSNWDTSKVTKMDAIFSNCKSLETVDVSKWNVENVTTFGSAFVNCESLKAIDVSAWNTGKASGFGSMFSDCGSLTELDVSNFDTGNATDLHMMFDGCKNVKSLDVSGFRTEKVVKMSAMFMECEGLTEIDLASFNTSKVTDMGSLFGGCINLKALDVSNFDMTNVTKCYGFDNRTDALTDIRLGDKCRFVDETENREWTRTSDISGAAVSSPTINSLSEYDPAYPGWYHRETAEEPSGGDDPAPAEIEIEEGTVEPYKGNTYTVTSASDKTVAFTKAKNTKTVTVPLTVTLSDGNIYKVTSVGAKAFRGKSIRSVTINKNIRRIEKNAFYGSKVTTITVKSKLLKKAGVKGSLKGSKVKTVKVKVGTKKQNKTYVKKYKKYFTKTNAGKKVTVK